MGCESSVVLMKLQISTESSVGFSVTGACQGVPFSSMAMDSPAMVPFVSANARGTSPDGGRFGVFGTEPQRSGQAGWHPMISTGAYTKLHDQKRNRLCSTICPACCSRRSR